MIFREAKKEDREFILNANKEINILSGLTDSSLEKRIDKDLFEDKILKSVIAEIDGKAVGLVLYSYVYWANCGKGIYLSQAYVDKNYRKQGILKKIHEEIEKREPECNFFSNLVGEENTVVQKTLDKLEFTKSDLITYYKSINK